MKQPHFDVLVIGGGHAGSEAAYAAARMGAQVGLVTLEPTKIGVMSCNPAIGGLGKGHIVREIDAMGGLMGRAADFAGIQFRLLNRRKGPAVQGPRAQSDRALYQEAVQTILGSCANLSVIAGEVVDIQNGRENEKLVVLGDGSEVSAGAVILTTGTFLGGTIHIGKEQRSAGRFGEAAANRLAERLRAMDLPIGRLKTGTPPRLDGRTIAWDQLEMQPGDDDPTFFSFDTSKVSARQISCSITHTNRQTHDIIRANLGQSAMYGGVIEGVGPRYCPSIEDKVVRFEDKASHQVFLEPEGLNDTTVYPNGISTSLPADVQGAYVQSIVGLENAEILQPGYAIEYDYVDPRALSLDLQLPDMPMVFLAGQINGTTGYEEAAAQGLMAGINAVLAVRGEERFALSRSDAYIGVMIDDLTTKGVSEPYRMFTSRAEYRLNLRIDNADQRLSPMAHRLGLLTTSRWDAFSRKVERLDAARSVLGGMSVTPKEARISNIDVREDGSKRNGFELLALADVEFDQVAALAPELQQTDVPTQAQLKRESLYHNYIERQRRDIEEMQRDASWEIPSNFDFGGLPGLSNELRQKLQRVKPQTLDQASRIEGMTPAAIVLLLARLKSQHRKAS